MTASFVFPGMMTLKRKLKRIRQNKEIQVDALQSNCDADTNMKTEHWTNHLITIFTQPDTHWMTYSLAVSLITAINVVQLEQISCSSLYYRMTPIGGRSIADRKDIENIWCRALVGRCCEQAIKNIVRYIHFMGKKNMITNGIQNIQLFHTISFCFLVLYLFVAC